MADIFGGLLGSPHNVAARRAYGSVIAFRGRKEMVEAAAEAYFFEKKPSGRLPEALAELLKYASGFCARRNEIAHGKVVSIQSVLPPENPRFRSFKKPRIGYVLAPTNYATNKSELEPPLSLLSLIGQKPNYVYSSAEVGYFEKEFEDLMDRATHVCIELYDQISAQLAASLR